LALGDFLLQLLVQVSQDRLDLVAEEELLLVVVDKLDADSFAEVTGDCSLAGA